MAARTLLPSPEKVRILTASKDLKPEDADRYGDLFFEAGLTAQAMMFYERAKSPDRLARVKAHAVAGGDAFILTWLHRLSPELIFEPEWEQAGERALADGKVLFARDCFERANLPERAQEARELYLKIFRDLPPRPAMAPIPSEAKAPRAEEHPQPEGGF